MRLPQPVLSFAAKSALRVPPALNPFFRAGLSLVGMPRTGRFVQYVIDFEHALKSDDWRRVGTYFAPDAVYEVRNSSGYDCRLEGRDAILAGFKRSLDGFDRQLRRRLFMAEGPHEYADLSSVVGRSSHDDLPAHDGVVTFVWKGSYDAPDTPPLRLSARQTALYRDGLIVWLEDDYLPGSADAAAWLAEHAPELSPRYTLSDA